MFGFSRAIAPWQIRQVFKELVGTEADNAFWRRWYDSFITRDDIRYIRATGMNIVRVPFDYRLFTPEEYPGTWVGIGFELLDRVVEWSQDAGLFVLLDMHAAPCGQNPWNVDYGNPYLFEDPACLSRTVEIWRRIARHYARNRNVIGYDLLNEPAPREGDNRQALLDAANEKIAAAIREVDRKPPPFRRRACNRKHLQKYSESRALHESSSTLSTPTGPSRASRPSRSIFVSRRSTMSRSFSASPARTRMNG